MPLRKSIGHPLANCIHTDCSLLGSADVSLARNRSESYKLGTTFNEM